MRIPDSLRILGNNLLFNSLIGAKWFPRPFRAWALRRAGVACGKSMILAEVFFDGRNIRKVKIGDGCVINNQVYLDACGDITIGDRTGLAAGVRVMTADHEMGGREQRWGELTPQPVTIGNGVWVGAGAIILPGVTIGDGVVIGAGSLVTKDCEPDAIYAGCPARLLRRLDRDSGETAAAPLDEQA